jgi:hypothetical protein
MFVKFVKSNKSGKIACLKCDCGKSSIVGLIDCDICGSVVVSPAKCPGCGISTDVDGIDTHLPTGCPYDDDGDDLEAEEIEAFWNPEEVDF